eukprot:4812725-Alexandrium_andersonii.AAC.1
MSASLVGSEMCIRDRTCTSQCRIIAGLRAWSAAAIMTPHMLVADSLPAILSAMHARLTFAVGSRGLDAPVGSLQSRVL